MALIALIDLNTLIILMAPNALPALTALISLNALISSIFIELVGRCYVVALLLLCGC